MDIKQIAEAIKAETDPEKLTKLYGDYQKQIDELNDKAGKFDEVSQKGIFKELEETRKKLVEFETAKKKAEEDDAIKKGELQKVIDLKTKELEEKDNKIKTLESEVDPLKKFKTDREAEDEKRKADLIAKLPNDDLKDIAKELSGIKLERFVELNKTPSAAKPDSGDAAGGGVTALTEEQKKDAAEKFPSISDEKEREILYKEYLSVKPKKKE